MYKSELEIDVMRCIRALYKKGIYILLITVLFFVLRLGLTLDVGQNKYQSVATVYAAADNSYSEAANAVTAMNAYLDVATSYKVCQRAALILGRNDIDASDVQKALYVNSSAKQTSSSTAITNFLNSSATIISFYATTIDPELSREIADAAAESYTIEMGNILKADTVKILDTASLGELSVNANAQAWKSRFKYALIGFVLACVVVICSEVFDKKVRSIREATIKNQIPIIGVIPDYKD